MARDCFTLGSGWDEGVNWQRGTGDVSRVEGTGNMQPSFGRRFANISIPLDEEANVLVSLMGPDTRRKKESMLYVSSFCHSGQ